MVSVATSYQQQDWAGDIYIFPSEFYSSYPVCYIEMKIWKNNDFSVINHDQMIVSFLNK